MNKFLLVIALGVLCSCGNLPETNSIVEQNNLTYHSIPSKWGPSHPLANGLLGAQIWQNESHLRINLDCAYLWDLRPMKDIDKLTFQMVKEHVDNNEYKLIQQLGDNPYVNTSAPCKILGSTILFDPKPLGIVKDYTLNFLTGSCDIRWKSGATLETFIHATEPVGWFRFTNVPDDFKPTLEMPVYSGQKVIDGGVIKTGSAHAAASLGYQQGKLAETANKLVYTQQGWGNFSYQVAVKWKNKNHVLEGTWSVSAKFPKDNIYYDEKSYVATQEVDKAISEGFETYQSSHRLWWKNSWNQASVSLPEDSVLEQWWYADQYRFFAAARRGAPAVSLQSVWSNDNGLLPSWKGDYHNDLNTQNVYWAAYSGNQLEGDWTLIDWLWKLRPAFRKYTKDFYQLEGLNVPGCCMLDGKPMGGWIQYANAPTTSAWFAHHFYQHWRYSMDRDFLEERAYPWFKETITFLNQLTVIDEKGVRGLPLSSSPEYFDNSIRAWFKQTTNYDLALIRNTYIRGAELAGELGYNDVQNEWLKIASEWPDFDLDNEGGLTIAPGQPLDSNHRHHSHLMSIFPLNLLDMAHGEKDQNIINASLKKLQVYGPTVWPLHTATFYARAWDGEGALKCLQQELNNPKTYYYEKDGSKHLFLRKSDWFFKISIQEMLLQSHSKYIHIFPAIPAKWKNCSFNKLRAEGAFLVSAVRKNGETVSVTIFSEKGGSLRIKNPFGSDYHDDRVKSDASNMIWEYECKPNETLTFSR